MARKSRGPWWWDARGQWFVTQGGKQIPLGADEDEARRQWHFMEASAQIQTAGDRNTFTVLADAFLDEVKRNRKPKTFKVYRIFLEAFGKVHETLKVVDLKPYHLSEVLRLHPKWGKSTTRGFMVCISTTMNWGIKTGYTTTNPLHRRLTIPKVRSRGGDNNIPIGDDDYAILLEHANEPLRDFLIAARNTGTRPNTIATVEARHFNEGAACWAMDAHKTDEDGSTLIVHLNPTMMALTKKLIARNPTGPIFLNNRGNPWQDATWGKAMAGMRKQLKDKGIKLKSSGIMYGMRHQYATSLLEAGVHESHVAVMMGHKSTVMLSKHYSHLSAQHATLKAHLDHIKPTGGESEA